jgi:hypothetical protein
MRASCWHGRNDVRCEKVPDPSIQNGSGETRLPLDPSTRLVDVVLGLGQELLKRSRIMFDV